MNNIWYISEDFRSYDKGEEVSFVGGSDDTKVLSVFNLYCAIICDIKTLHNLLNISGKENVDELGYTWVVGDYGEGYETKFFSDKQLCDENDIKEWYICDSYNVDNYNNMVKAKGLKAIFIGTRENFKNIIIDKHGKRDWTFITKRIFNNRQLFIDNIRIE